MVMSLFFDGSQSAAVFAMHLTTAVFAMHLAICVTTTSATQLFVLAMPRIVVYRIVAAWSDTQGCHGLSRMLAEHIYSRTNMFGQKAKFTPEV